MIMTKKDLSRLASDIRCMLHNQYMLAVCCNDIEKYAGLFARMEALVPGNLVAEMSTIYNPDKDFIAVGYFIKAVKEKIYPDAEDPEDREITDTFTYIKTLDGEEQRWENCRFVRAYIDRV